MKLIFCPACTDVFRLVPDVWRKCMCGASGGQYNRDNMTATVGGNARVFGVGNPFFNELYVFLPFDAKREVRHKMYGQTDTDAWWGEYPGDKQIFRIHSADGPRLTIKVIPRGANNLIKVTDKRSWWIQDWHGKRGVPVELLVPANPKPKAGQVTSWKKSSEKGPAN
jgi:hypothetical protein